MAARRAGSTSEDQKPLVVLHWGDVWAEAFWMALGIWDRGQEGKGDSTEGGTGTSFACSPVFA